jgi:exonuclease VII small subunit
MDKEKENLNVVNGLSRLEEIAAWFEGQEEVDVEEGLKLVKEAAILIQDLKKRLSKAENEFQEVKKSLEEQEGVDG